MQLSNLLSILVLLTASVFAAPRLSIPATPIFRRWDGSVVDTREARRYDHISRVLPRVGIVSGTVPRPPVTTGDLAPYLNSTDPGLNSTSDFNSSSTFNSSSSSSSTSDSSSTPGPVSLSSSSSSACTSQEPVTITVEISATITRYISPITANATRTAGPPYPTGNATESLDSPPSVDTTFPLITTLTLNIVPLITVSNEPVPTTTVSRTTPVSSIIITSGLTFVPQTTNTSASYYAPTSIAATKTVSGDASVNTTVPIASSLAKRFCGIHGEPNGQYKLGEINDSSNGVDVTLQSCGVFCASLAGVSMGCQSFSYYLEDETEAPRCDLFGASVSQSIDSVIPEDTRVWYDLGCAVPPTGSGSSI